MDDLFTLLLNLPKELQLEIWERTISDAQIIELEPECFTRNENGIARRFTRISAKVNKHSIAILYAKNNDTKVIPPKLLARI